MVLALLLLDPWATAWIKAHFRHARDGRAVPDLELARRLFPEDLLGDRFRRDPQSLLAFRPDHGEYLPWPEHPDGGFWLRTNNLGLRRDAPTLATKRGPRVLITGDSHTAGLVNNAETFASLLEDALRAARGEPELEVLDAGVAYTGPTAYHGMLRKHLDLAPDVCVAVVFCGNDFWDELHAGYLLDGWSPPVGSRSYRGPLERAAERWSGPLGQGYNQLYRWKHFPWEPARALERTLAALRAMHARCVDDGVAFLAALLPTKAQVEPADDAAALEALARELGLAPEDLDANRRMGLALLEELRAEGIDCIDLLPGLSRVEPPLYWRSDHHLAVRGHAAVGALLEAPVGDLLARSTGR